MAFGGNCPQCALSHYACQHLLSSTNYNPDSQLLSKYVIRANVTATKLVCLEKAGYLLPGPHKLCPAKCPQIVLSVGSSIINCMRTVLSYCEIHHLDIFHQKVGQNISTENIFHWQIASGQNVTGLMSEPSCRFSPFLGKHSWTKKKIQIKFLQYMSSFCYKNSKNRHN